MKRGSHTSDSNEQGSSRRAVLKWGGKVAAASTLTGLNLSAIYAAEDNAIRLALIGCGGRGCGAAANAFDSPNGPVELVAMADFFENRLGNAHGALSGRYGAQMDVPPERRFVGFDAWRKAIDCLRPGDVAMNVFMEKSFATGPPAVRRVIKAGKAAEKKNLKIAAGLQCRHSRNRQELIKRLRDGQLGEVELIRAYRMQPCSPLRLRPADVKDLHWQIRNFTHFLWVSGGLFAEMNIHQIDEICWIKGALPISAHGIS